MNYRRLGRSGLKVSELSFGSWVTYGSQLDTKLARECMAAAWDAGVNFFDNAEVYAGGKSEQIMGAALADLRWPREKYVVSTKFFWGLSDGPNQRNTLNRKYLLHAIEASLLRFGLEYVDLVYCHRPDPNTPIEETVWAMHDMISRGRALYWGTSEWSADEIRAAWDIAERHHLHKPVMEQPEYNLFRRRRVEREYLRLYEDIGLGLTTWSPLASGLLTGKYRDGIPDDSRAALKGYDWLREALTDPARNAAVADLQAVASDLGCTLPQLAIAWCASNPHVSTVITGASKPEQVVENMKAQDVIARIDAGVRERIDALTGKLAR
ncbi:aldo/keto reductase [Sinimarinibacterium sp. CAU 1509]|uniref:potassium channel beta subunit family protein n=1 Tax=Sinimarinibacterium sp. CAU 1509 TaxID=2562283 RepID=UPI0010ACA935|nr:aldo/keto reductase [Sinimarinibacterium sp. CAU 1509]TJY59024.1 aldo/keto reductase [Sinimarinibacterium sp. CAU 1509]